MNRNAGDEALKQSILFPKQALVSHSSEKKGSSSDTAPKRNLFFLIFFLSLGKIKWLVSFRTERKMQIPQSERSLISGSHPSHVLCVFQTDLTLPGFYSTDSGNKPGFAAKTNLNMLKITRFCCTFVSEWAQGSKRNVCITWHVNCSSPVGGQKRGLKEQYLVLFYQLFWERTCFSKQFWKGHNICTIKTILLSKRDCFRESYAEITHF